MSSFSSTPVISLIGGIGSGKSSVSQELSRRRCVHLINADQIGHEVLQEDSVIEQMKATFGSKVIDESGAVSRPAVASIVFGDSPEQQQALENLENIVHPHIRSRIQNKIWAARQSGSYDLIILDAALLLEGGWDSVCDLVVYLEVPEEIRLQRVTENRNWTESDFRKREASQLSLVEKKARSDCSISNHSDLKAAVDQLEFHLNQIS